MKFKNLNENMDYGLDKIKDPILFNTSGLDKETIEVLRYLDHEGYDADAKDVRNYADAVAEYIDMIRSTGEDYSVADWYRDTTENYPEELSDLSIRDYDYNDVASESLGEAYVLDSEADWALDNKLVRTDLYTKVRGGKLSHVFKSEIDGRLYALELEPDLEGYRYVGTFPEYCEKITPEITQAMVYQRQLEGLEKPLDENFGDYYWGDHKYDNVEIGDRVLYKEYPNAPVKKATVIDSNNYGKEFTLKFEDNTTTSGVTKSNLRLVKEDYDKFEYDTWSDDSGERFSFNFYPFDVYGILKNGKDKELYYHLKKSDAIKAAKEYASKNHRFAKIIVTDGYDFDDVIFDSSKDKSLVKESLIDPTQEDIEAFEEIIAYNDFDIEKKGKTLFGNLHYQIIDNQGAEINSQEALRERIENFIEDIDKFEEDYNIPVTWNFGVNDEGILTAGVDLREKFVDDEDLEVTTDDLNGGQWYESLDEARTKRPPNYQLIFLESGICTKDEWPRVRKEQIDKYKDKYQGVNCWITYMGSKSGTRWWETTALKDDYIDFYESLDEDLSDIEVKCRDKFNELETILLSGQNADVENNIKKAFKAVNGKVWFKEKSPTYLSFDGKVGNYTLTNSVSMHDLRADLIRLAEDLIMAYNVLLGGEREYTPNFIKRILNSTNVSESKNSLKESSDDTYYNSVIQDLESIESFLRKENFTSFDVSDYDVYPMQTSVISFVVEGDWKHEHQLFRNLLYKWSQETGRNIFKIDEQEIGESDSDWYTSTYKVFITKDEDTMNTLNSMRGLFESNDSYFTESNDELSYEALSALRNFKKTAEYGDSIKLDVNGEKVTIQKEYGGWYLTCSKAKFAGTYKNIEAAVKDLATGRFDRQKEKTLGEDLNNKKVQLTYERSRYGGFCTNTYEPPVLTDLDEYIEQFDSIEGNENSKYCLILLSSNISYSYYDKIVFSDSLQELKQEAKDWLDGVTSPHSDEMILEYHYYAMIVDLESMTEISRGDAWQAREDGRIQKGWISLDESLNEDYAEDHLKRLISVHHFISPKDRIQLFTTPKGNYEVRRNGKKTMIIGTENFRESEIEDLRLNGYFDDYDEMRMNESLKESYVPVTLDRIKDAPYAEDIYSTNPHGIVRIKTDHGYKTYTKRNKNYWVRNTGSMSGYEEFNDQQIFDLAKNNKNAEIWVEPVDESLNEAKKKDIIDALRHEKLSKDGFLQVGDASRGWTAQIQDHGAQEFDMKYNSSKFKSGAWGRIWKNRKLVKQFNGPVNVVRDQMIKFFENKLLEQLKEDNGSSIEKYDSNISYADRYRVKVANCKCPLCNSASLKLVDYVDDYVVCDNCGAELESIEKPNGSITFKTWEYDYTPDPNHENDFEISYGKDYDPDFEWDKDNLELVSDELNAGQWLESLKEDFSMEEKRKDFIEAIQLCKEYDPYTMYIDDYNQEKRAEEINKKRESRFISIMAKYGIKSEGIPTFITRAYCSSDRDYIDALKEYVSFKRSSGMTNKEIVEALNKFDNQAINEDTTFYDLKNLYEATQLKAEDRRRLADAIRNGDDPVLIATFLSDKLKEVDEDLEEDIINEDYEEDELEFFEDDLGFLEDYLETDVPDVVVETEIVETDMPEQGEDIGLSDMILDSIESSAEKIREYNSLSANLGEHEEELKDVLEDISVNENETLGKLQSMLKAISPNAENIMNGAVEAEEQMGVEE